MFTGIIHTQGKVKKILARKDKTTLEISSNLSILKKGSSISVNGVCLTVTKNKPSSFEVEIVPETILRSNLHHLNIGSNVNLETALKYQENIDGHLVLGHVDAAVPILDIKSAGSSKIFTIQIPDNLHRFFSFKGSIAINGVSLTISNLQNDTFSVTIIPYTFKHSNLGSLQINDLVNIEIDLIARYLDRLLQKHETQKNYHWLKERNFI